MKNGASLFVFLTFCFFTSHSQTGSHKSYLGISIGPSFPVGHYAQDNLNNSSSGFANPGQAVSISYSRLIGPRFGIAATLNGQRNPLDTRSMEEQFSKIGIPNGVWTISDPTQPLPPIQTVNYTNWEFEKQSWLLGSFLLGGYGEFPLSNEKIALTAKAMAGAAWAAAPSAKGSSITDTDTATANFEQTKSSAFGFAYSMCGGLKVDISKSLSFLANVEYLETNNIKFDVVSATFTTTHGTPGTPGYAVQQLVTMGAPRQTISSINVLIGIAIKL